MSKDLNSTTSVPVDVEQLNTYDRIAALVAENKKVAEIYIKKGATGMLIFDFFWGFIKAFFYMFIALFKGAAGSSGGDIYGGLFRFFRAIFDAVAFPFVYGFRVSTTKNQKKQAEEIVASDTQSLQEIQNYFDGSAQVNLREKVELIVANNEILKSFDKPKK